MTKSVNQFNFSYIGIPLSPLLPPCTVKPATNIIVAIKVATIILEFAVCFIHLSLSFSNSLFSFVNNSLGIFPSLFLTLWSGDGTSLHGMNCLVVMEITLNNFIHTGEYAHSKTFTLSRERYL
ncbi:hypothetical protein R3W88_029766 [Solanum pinnatisectum]|uniref:Uncharacterized protein n=1 Tax=Solanum pinnatisectum TaxID=50273 RepID=A0AAV9K692_9SOLN|nr:hypothetical protein R3W88_029766 [Solanum pinnatisectum]